MIDKKITLMYSYIMARKITSLLLFFVLFTANTSFAFYEAGNLIIEKRAENKSYAVDSRVLFVQDYSKILSDIRESMKNPLAVFSLNIGKSVSVFKNTESKAFTLQNTYVINKYEKISVLLTNAKEIFCGINFPLIIKYILIFIFSFMLLYIGLLRLFNAIAINKNNIFRKSGFMY